MSLKVMPRQAKDQTVEECLQEALAKSGEMEKVLILYESGEGKAVARSIMA